MDAKAAETVLNLLEALGAGYYMFGKGTVDSRRDLPRHISETDPEHLLKLKQRVCYQYGLDACRAALKRPVYKFFVYFDKDSSMARDISSAFTSITGIGVTQSSSSNLEIMSSTADKGVGLRVLCQALGINPEQTMALGDQLNDLPMIRYAGLGIAMGNAPDTVKQAADAVTQSNTEDGVGKAIAKYVLLDYPVIGL
jgi:Cof subfamily protein (haloacid dehalogenase superfamily)